MRTEIPRLDQQLPELTAFAQQAAADFGAGSLTSWSQMNGRVKSFFTPARMTAVGTIAPGWQNMATEGNGITLVHVMTVFTGLYLLPEFQQANPIQQALCEWAVLFHDIAKVVQKGQRDLNHGFRSAAATAVALPAAGFPKTAVYDEKISGWVTLTRTAVTQTAASIQDNQKLPQILAELDQLFGVNSPATLITQTVLLHMSVNAVNSYPQAAPLTDAEVKQFVGDALRPLLKIMMLADNEGWSLFDEVVRSQQRQETLAAFARIENM